MLTSHYFYAGSRSWELERIRSKPNNIFKASEDAVTSQWFQETQELGMPSAALVLFLGLGTEVKPLQSTLIKGRKSTLFLVAEKIFGPVWTHPAKPTRL